MLRQLIKEPVSNVLVEHDMSVCTIDDPIKKILLSKNCIFIA